MNPYLAPAAGIGAVVAWLVLRFIGSDWWRGRKQALQRLREVHRELKRYDN